MRINEIKVKVYERCGVKSTAQLKKQYTHLTQGKDLRYKTSWQVILDDLNNDYTLADLENDTQQIKQSLHRVGRALGKSYRNIEENWEKMNNKPVEESYTAVEQEYLASLGVH